jgi:hypothetical protein
MSPTDAERVGHELLVFAWPEPPNAKSAGKSAGTETPRTGRMAPSRSCAGATGFLLALPACRPPLHPPRMRAGTTGRGGPHPPWGRFAFPLGCRHAPLRRVPSFRVSPIERITCGAETLAAPLGRAAGGLQRKPAPEARRQNGARAACNTAAPVNPSLRRAAAF